MLSESSSPIQAVLVPGNSNVLRAAESLRLAGFDVRAIRPPTVPAGTERLRVILHAHNTEAEVLRLAACIRRNARAWVKGSGASQTGTSQGRAALKETVAWDEEPEGEIGDVAVLSRL